MSLQPTHAILFHRATSNGAMSASNNFATLHTIDSSQSHPIIKEGQLMSHQTITDVLSEMTGLQKQNPLQISPENVLAQSDDSLVWYVQASFRPMLLKVNSRPLKINVPYPTLIFKVVGDELSVTASRFKRKPKADDNVYFAPLMNVYGTHKVCVGNADCPDSAEIENKEDWEQVMFSTYYTHTNHAHTLSSKDHKEITTAHLYSFWKKLKNKTTFPVKQLNNDSGTTLSQWIEA